jgi:hypothetical protein
MAHGPFTNSADFTSELLVEVYQGEEEFVAANTRIGQVKIEKLEPLPRGQQMLEVKFILDVSGTLSTICTDVRTGNTYEGSFTFDGITRMSADEIKAKRAMVMAQMAGVGAPSQGPPPPAAAPPTQAPSAEATPVTVPPLAPEQVPTDWRDFWLQGQELLPSLDSANKAVLTTAMAQFANAVLSSNESEIEDKAYLLQDALLEVQLA